MTAGRSLLRLAWRDARRDRWRTVLVVALVALPVALLGGAITSFDSINATPEERVADVMGRADGWVQPLGIEHDLDDVHAEVAGALAAELPDGTRIETRSFASDLLILPGQRVEVRLTDAAVEGDHLGVGRLRLQHGRAPLADGEVAVTEALAAALGSTIGDRLQLDTLGDVEVVGVVRRPERLSERGVILPPESLAPAMTDHLELLVELPPGASSTELVALTGSRMEGEQQWWGTTREQELAERYTGGTRWVAVVIGGLAVVEVALIVGATFAVSVRRRQRELGLLAAIGATTRHVRRAVLLTGLSAGLLGAAIGTVIGLLGVLAAYPWYQALVDRQLTGLRIDAPWITAVAAVGVASTLLGAWWPARSVARLPVTVALSGRRPAPEPSVRGLRIGIVVIAASIAVFGLAVGLRAQDPYVFLLASVLLVLGTGLTSPWLLEQLGRLAPRLPVGPRLAVRDAARFRTRNGPIVTAAMAGLAGAVAIATVAVSLERHESQHYLPSQARDQVLVFGRGAEAVAAAIVTELGGRSVSFGHTNGFATLVEAAPDPTDGPVGATGTVAIGEPDLAELLGGRPAVDALSRGEAVVLGQEAERLEVWRWEEDGREPQETLLGEFAVTSLPAPDGVDPRWASFPTVLVPTAVGEELTAHQDVAIVQLPEPVDDEMHERIVAIASDGSGEVFAQTERGFRSPYRRVMIAVLGFGALTGLALVAVAIALAAAEARGDLRTLTAVGADRATRRSLAAGRALLLTLLGGVLAVPVGFLPGAAVMLRMSNIELAVPWAAFAVVALAVPAVATLGALVVSRRDPGISLRTAA